MRTKIPSVTPLWTLGAAVVAFEACAAALGLRSLVLSAGALCLGPGLALSALLPHRLQHRPVAHLAAVPSLGFAAASVALVSIARLGIPLDAWSVRITVAGLVLAGALLRARRETRARPSGWEVAGLAAALVAAVVLERRVIGGTPVPGGDWAKYLLYGEEIRRQGSLLIDNPYWMLGVPFREEPAVPAIYGAALATSSSAAGALAHGIWGFALAGVLATFALVRAFAGAGAAVVGGALYAVVPANHEILGWHGLPNVAALALLALALLYAGALARDGLTWAEAVGAGLVLVALAATHRLSLVVGLAALGLGGGVSLLLGSRRGRRRIWEGGARVAGASVVLGGPVAADLIARQRTFDGTQSHEAYLSTKLTLDYAVDNLTVPLLAAGGAAVLVLLLAGRRGRDGWPALGLLAIAVALTYSWFAELPLYYSRMVYFLPLALVAIVALALDRVPARMAILPVGLALAVAMAAIGWERTREVRRFYTSADTAALRGVESLRRRLRPGEPVVTDGCWGFLSTWLLRTPTLAALPPRDIQPKAELRSALRARHVLDGTRAGRRDARRMGVRWVLADPRCGPFPRVGTSAFRSERLEVRLLRRT